MEGQLFELRLIRRRQDLDAALPVYDPLEAGGSSGHMPFYNSLLSGLRLLLLLEKNMSSSRDLILQQLTTRDLLWVPFGQRRHSSRQPLLPQVLTHQQQMILQQLIARIIYV